MTGALPQHIAVLGGGRMGAGIAHALLLAGCSVVLVEGNAQAAKAAAGRVRDAVLATESRGGLTGSVEEVLSRLDSGADRSAMAGAGLVIEAVPEIAALKAELLGAAAVVVGPQTVIASNTSSLSIDELSAAVGHPERFLGLHFFNPVPASTLVEIVVGTATAAEVVSRATEWVEALGKTPIVVRDSPGFASSRLGLALGLEAIRMVADGVASAEDIDAAMTLGYKHPVGPLRLTDIVGLDVRLGIAEYLATTLGDRYAPPQLLRDMVARGELGRKTGRGFYRW